jgi:hypothetical protein
MKRVLSIAAAGLFVAGLSLSPIAASADQTVVGGKTTSPVTSQTSSPDHTTVTKKPETPSSGGVSSGNSATSPSPSPAGTVGKTPAKTSL